jgi:hypothetical protein
MTNILDQLKLGSSDLRVRRFSDTDEADITDFNRYGNWTNDTEGHYIVPSLLSYSNYSGSLVNRSNHKAFSDAFDAGYNVWWTDAPGGHGTNCIVIDASIVPLEIAKDVVSFLNGLQDYPLADESLHSKMELEAQEEAWDNWAKDDFVTAIQRIFNIDFEDTPDSQLLFDIFHETADNAGQYWVNESAGDMWIDVKRVARALPQKDFNRLLATTIDPVAAINRYMKAEKQVASLKAAVIKKHNDYLEVGMVKDELQALLDALDISSIEWERIKAIGKLPNGREVRT